MAGSCSVSVDDVVAVALRVVRGCRDPGVVWRVKRLVGEFLNGDIDLSTFYMQLRFIEGIRGE